jgi:hypothetical protein
MRKRLLIGIAVLAPCTVAAVMLAAESKAAPAAAKPAEAKPAAAHEGHEGMAMSKHKMTDAQIIASAVKAAPAAVGKDAGVVDVGADGKMRTVRESKNGFTCMADNPETPGPDPMCMDANAMAWAGAWMKHETPPGDKVGLMYMLAGGTDASNTDPYATKPTKENHWVKTGAHVMVVGSKSLLEGYPHDADPDTKKPYVMWAGTPYEHLMIPVH